MDGMVVTEVLGSGRTGLLYLAEDAASRRSAVLRLRLAVEAPGFVEEALGFLPRSDGHRHQRGHLPDGTAVEWVVVQGSRAPGAASPEPSASPGAWRAAASPPAAGPPRAAVPPPPPPAWRPSAPTTSAPAPSRASPSLGSAPPTSARASIAPPRRPAAVRSWSVPAVSRPPRSVLPQPAPGRVLFGALLVLGSAAGVVAGAAAGPTPAVREAACVPDARWRERVAGLLREAEAAAASDPRLASALRRRRALLAGALTASGPRACHEVEAALASLRLQPPPRRR